ncbi:MAG: HAMP domain-containing histidine kinase, partial [Lachnospiraceae bacterium]|nr:HAMP domain-containing histidine kinase [Lachnospiraceae bacterium]
MKLGAKIIVSIMIFFSVIFLFGGYILISYFYEITMEGKIENAAKQYQYNKFVIQANLISRGESWFEGAVEESYDMSAMAQDLNGIVAFFTMEGQTLFSGFPEGTEFSNVLTGARTDKVNYQFRKLGNRTFLFLVGIVAYENVGVYLVTGIDVEEILVQQEQIVGKFGTVYALAVGIGICLVYGISVFITKPIQELTIATKKIAEGDYKERVAQAGTDEVGQLAGNFNRMAAAVEEKIEELSENARQKEDFVANFAHELKTPLTSMIGYADRIYQKELPREEQKKAAWYIWNEGMRLEALSLKLMDLTVLNHKEFCLQEVRTDQLFYELAEEVAFLLGEKGVELELFIEPAYIRVEYDLFQSLFLNLVDNAVKAGAQRLSVTGCVESIGEEPADGLYFFIKMKDDGSGIPKQEIRRIKEAFYMVDKSRSRKQHGAGIGLALSEKIAQIP